MRGMKRQRQIAKRVELVFLADLHTLGRDTITTHDARNGRGKALRLKPDPARRGRRGGIDIDPGSLLIQPEFKAGNRLKAGHLHAARVDPRLYQWRCLDPRAVFRYKIKPNQALRDLSVHTDFDKQGQNFRHASGGGRARCRSRQPCHRAAMQKGQRRETVSRPALHFPSERSATKFRPATE